jgi:hypothetical protein
LIYKLIRMFVKKITMPILCSFGCGKEAKYFFKTGNGYCEYSPNSCVEKKRRDSEKKKGTFKGIMYSKLVGEKKPLNPWNKGKKGIYTDEHRKKISNALKNIAKGIASTPEKEQLRKLKISETAKKNKLSGGLRSGSGLGKKGRYKGYWCDSSWELAWVIYSLEHNVKFERNNVGFIYNHNGQDRKYYPDFVVGETYYEIKGRKSYEQLDEENKQKISQFKKNLVVLYSKEMQTYLNYVIDKYGKNFTDLYESTK